MNGSEHVEELLSNRKWEILQVAKRILVPQEGLYSNYVLPASKGEAGAGIAQSV
jgi:hypothetical protein